MPAAVIVDIDIDIDIVVAQGQRRPFAPRQRAGTDSCR